MNKSNIVKIMIAVAVVLVVAAVGVLIGTKVIGGDESTTISSELVAPSVAMPSGENAENQGNAGQSWNEGETLVQGIQVETTSPEMPDEQPGEVETLAAPETIDTSDITKKERVLLVLNAENRLPAEYVPHLEETVTGSGIYLEREAAAAFMEMYKAALGQGLTLTPYSGYVSFDRQQSKFNALVKTYQDMGYSEKEAEALAARKILPVGCSEHNAGLAVDLGSNTDDFKNTAEYKWLVKNAAKYGFIERYTEELEDETGVDAAPWHWRYVGSAAIAEAINESDMSFEEWMYYEYPDWEDPEATEEATTLEEDATEADADAESIDEEATADSAEDKEDTTEEEATTVVIDLDAQ